MKAVRINKDNKRKLAIQFQKDEDFLEHSSGMLLIADFGATTYHSILTPKAFNERYKVVKNLENSYVEIVPKSA